MYRVVKMKLEQRFRNYARLKHIPLPEHQNSIYEKYLLLFLMKFWEGPFYQNI